METVSGKGESGTGRMLLIQGSIEQSSCNLLETHTEDFFFNYYIHVGAEKCSPRLRHNVVKIFEDFFSK